MAEDRERTDLLETLRRQRGLLRQTIDGLSDEQIRTRSTVSELTIGAIIKHVTVMESIWREFILGGATALSRSTPGQSASQWRVDDGETAESLLSVYDASAARTDRVIETADLDAEHLFPDSPRFTPGQSWSVRRVALHILAETAQHAGHADIVREAIDGAKTMG